MADSHAPCNGRCVRYTLVTPFTCSAKIYREHVEVRDHMTGGDLMAARRASTDTTEQSFIITARMCGLLKEDVEKMDVRDIDAIGDLIEGVRSPKPTADSATAV